MNKEPFTDTTPKMTRPPFRRGYLTACGIGVMLLLLWILKWRGAIVWSGPLIVVLSLVGFAIICVGRTWRLPTISETAIQQAFNRVRRGRLRCLSFQAPRDWKLDKLDFGAYRLHVRELNNLVVINVGVDWLWALQSHIDCVEAYRDYADRFVRETLKGQMLRNEITTRWGVPAHEYEYAGECTTGWQITIPHHGTEYVMHVASRIQSLYPAARLAFGEFLKRCEFTPPPLRAESVFGGTLSIGIPPSFRLSSETPEAAIWTASAPHRATLTVRRHPLPLGVPLNQNMLESLVVDRPNPTDPYGITAFSMKDVGAAGFLTFEASNPGAKERSWFIALFELVTGGRYLIVFDADAPAAAGHAGHFQYVQICSEVIASMCENPELP